MTVASTDNKTTHINFATAALQGMLARPDAPIFQAQEAAERAWDMADAMVEEYRKRGGSFY
jgi:hypothetical protein